MSPAIRRSFAQALLVLLILALLLPGPLYASEEPPPAATEHQLYLPVAASASDADPHTVPAGILTQSIAEASQVSAAQLWTREKFLAAQPYDLLHPPGDPNLEAAAKTGGEELPAEAPLLTPSLPPHADAAQLARQSYADAWRNMEQLDRQRVAASQTNAVAAPLAADSIPYLPYTRYQVNGFNQTWQEYPWQAMGELFFQIPGYAGWYACTASVANRRSIWTAGHCLYTPGIGWHENIAFVPAYRDGYAPFGVFPIAAAGVLNPWAEGYIAYDVGTAIAADQSGHAVSWWVGSLGSAFNIAPWRLLYHSFGYPSNIDGGEYLIACVGARWLRESEIGPDPVAIGCDMKHGSSGGPWLIQYAPYAAGPVNYVNGLNSYGYEGVDLMYSPYFGSNARRLYEWGAQY